jgi:DNA-binding CsgD family transcriptional regulator
MNKEIELSTREHEILDLLTTGLTNREIAQKLFISPNTVKVHLRNIYEKLGVSSRTEATLYAIEHGLVKVPGQEEKTTQSKENAPSSLLQKYWWAILVVLGTLIIGAFLIGQNAADNNPEPVTESDNRWQTLAPLPDKTSRLAAISYNNFLYAIGGETEEGASSHTWQYDININQWAALEDKPTAVKDIKAGLIGELIYVPGGVDDAGKVSTTLEIFDPRTETWSAGAPLPHPISAYALATNEGQLYLFGGWNGEYVQDLTLIYDPTSNTWTEGSPMPTARAYASAAVVSNTIYVVGGWDGEKALPTNEAYLPSRDQAGELAWINEIELPESQYAVGLQSIGEIIFLLAQTEDQNTQILQYIPQQKEWLQTIETAPSPIQQHIATTTLQGFLYVLGGESNENERFDTSLRYQALFMILIPDIKK